MTDDLKTLTDTLLGQHLAEAQRDLQAACAESDRATKGTEADLRRARADGLTRERIRELEERHRAMCDTHVAAVCKARAGVLALEAETARRERERRLAAEAAMKARLRQRFLAAGGRPAEFEVAWPELRKQALAEAALGAPEPEPSAPVVPDAARAYRPRL